MDNNTLAGNIGRFIYDLSPIWIGFLIAIIIITILPVRSIMQKVEEIGTMMEEYEQVTRDDKSRYLPIIYDLIDQYYETKLPEPEYFWDARSYLDEDANYHTENMLNMDYPESLQLKRTTNATNLMYLDAVANPPNIPKNPDLGDSLAVAISQLIGDRQAGPPFRRHRNRKQAAKTPIEPYEVVTILAPPSQRPPQYFYYMVDRRTLPDDFQGIILAD